MKTQKIIQEQTDRKIAQLKKVEKVNIPSSGWINAIRLSLGMSLRQVGERMGITAQSVSEIEKREVNDTISLKVLKQFGYAHDMKFVYGFIPKSGSLEKLIEQKARQAATDIVTRTSVSMRLENQENSKKQIEKAIKKMTADIINEMPKYLWD